jgi:hypothetical protein
MRADLAGWVLPGEMPSAPGEHDPFGDDAAALADLALSRCTPPDVTWFDRAGKALAAKGGSPHKYPIEEWRAVDFPEDPEMAFGRRKHKRSWPGLIGVIVGRDWK